MSIIFDAKNKIFSLNTDRYTYQMQVDRYGHLLHLYFGRTNTGFISIPLVYADRGFSGNPYAAGGDKTYSMDVLPQEYPTLGTGDYRHYALDIENSERTEYCNLYYSHHMVHKGKYSLTGLPAVWAAPDEAETLEIVMKDPVSSVEVSLLYGVLPSADVITRAAKIRNVGEDALTIKKAAAATLDFLTGQFDFISFYGRHTMERMFQRVRVPHGVISVGSRRGTSSHEYNPVAILAHENTSERHGECWGMCFVYSGNFLCEVEKDQFNQTRLTMGLNDDFFEYPLKPGAEFTVPEVIMAYSGNGFSELSNIFQNCIRRHVCRGPYALSARPVVLNSWEANYFTFTGEDIIRLAREAADLGIDMVVMDDGWFGRRDDDNSSLGDWTVNEKKLGMSLKELVDKVNAYGVEFGIWIEPEMVNEDSDLYRAHPDWAIHVKNRAPIRGRNQLLLDFSRREVRDHIFDSICAVLDQANIRYVKWDMNRSMSDVYDGVVSYDYVVGVYDFLERLISRYPDLLIEGCSGGGGRFDAGMLYYTPQFWTSDNTDAIERTRIQFGTSFFYPVSSMAAHVSAVPNHQTGRVTPLFTRGVTAMTGAFGYELDPSKLSDREKKEIRRQVQFYKRYEELISNGRYYRLTSPFVDKLAAWESISPDRRNALVSVVRLRTEANMPVNYLRLRDLDQDALYINMKDGSIYTGAVLMQIGYPLPLPKEDYEAYQIPLVRLDEAYKVAKIIAEKHRPGERTVVGMYGCSGSGKTTLAAATAQYLDSMDLECYTLTGDEYARRIPKLNDAERERILHEEGVEGLTKYLASPEELDFDKMNEVIAQFKSGKDEIDVHFLGREIGEAKTLKINVSGGEVMLIEWTHAGSQHLEGVDLTVYIEASPEGTLERRLRRGRDANAATDLIRTVLEIEQCKLEAQSKHADIIVEENGNVHEQ